MLRFEIMKKCEFENRSEEIFAILNGNMSIIAPTGNTMEEDYLMWKNATFEELKNDARNIILINFFDILIGYFQYRVKAGDIFMMEDIQVMPEYQGKEYNVFRKLYGLIFSILSKNIKTVEAYASKKNYKSQAILAHLGLSVIGENKNGYSYHYQGSFDNLKKWYSNKGIG